MPRHLLRLISVLVLAALGLTLPTAGAFAAVSCDAGTYSVQSNANARVSPAADGRILASVPAGTQVAVSGPQLGDVVNGNGIWCVTTANGQTAYVHSSVLALVSAGAPAGDTGTGAPSAAGQTYKVINANSINGRGAPNANAKVLIVIPSGAEVTVTGQETGTRVNGSDLWYIVTYNGKNVYVHSSNLAPVAPPPPSDQPAAPAGPTGPMVAPKGNGVYIVGKDIAVGLWRSTPGRRDCYWERDDASQGILDNDFGMSGGFVAIQPGDYSVEFSRCGTFNYVDGQPITLHADAYAPKGDGFYQVGSEIASGNWTTTGPGARCYWASLGAYQEIHQNDFGVTGEKIYIPPTDFVFQVQNCGQLVYVG
jgi:hypothetical protein